MVTVHPVTLLLTIGGLAVVITTVPFLLAAIDYRQRDNGLAYLLLVSGVAVWNAMSVAQLLSQDPLIQVFFLGLSVVGAIQAGLGWFLFASTANSTSSALTSRVVYATLSILGGLDIVLAVTAPVHTVFWQLPTASVEAFGFAAVQPAFGYWLHTALLVVLFGAGTALFAETWRDRSDVQYPRAYTIAGTATVLAIVGGNILVPGGFSVAPIVAGSLTTIGWLQASRGRPLAWLHPA